MLPKLSVKKPYTVLVAVVLILVLGFLSFRNMSTDLMPDMELPYAIVMTVPRTAALSLCGVCCKE